MLARAARARGVRRARRPTSGPSASCSGRRSPAGTRSGTARCSRRRSGSRPARRRSPRLGPTCRSRSRRWSTACSPSIPAARPPAARLAVEVRDAFAERFRRRKPRTTLPPLDAARDEGGDQARRSGRRRRLRRVDRRGAAVLPATARADRSRCSHSALTLVRPAARTGLRARCAGAPARQRLLRARAPLRRLCLRLARALLEQARGRGCFLAVGPLLRSALALGFLPARLAGRPQPPAPSAPGRSRRAPRGGRRRPAPRAAAVHRGRTAARPGDHRQRRPVRRRRGALALAARPSRAAVRGARRSRRQPSFFRSRASAGSGRSPASAPACSRSRSSPRRAWRRRCRSCWPRWARRSHRPGVRTAGVRVPAAGHQLPRKPAE